MQAIETGRLNVVATSVAETKVMGYTDAPVAADVEVPANMQYWLECVNQAAAYVEQHPEHQLGTTRRASSTVVRPLLGNIEWDQSAPFNNLCPAGTPVGCVATAMAQIMRYWKHPQQGTGSHTWKWNGITHSVDFGATTYDWDKLLPKYSWGATAEQQAEVAKLSYHCGVSVDMMYAADGSGSWGQRVAGALQKYFDYNDRAGFVSRDSYSYEDWNELLVNELKAGRPILFTASNEEAGHAFVIDGVDADGLYHVNWGWNGWYNGYFDICILNPYGAGIGASESEFGFCMDQDAVIQICPDKGVGDLISPVHSSGSYPSSNEWAFVLSSYYENMTADTLQGVCAIEVLDSLDQHVSYVMGDTITLYPYPTWDNRHNRFYYAWTNTYAYASDFSDGAYTANLCFKHLKGDSIIYNVQTNYYQSPRYGFTVEAGQIVDAQNHIGGSNVIVGSDFSLDGQELATGKEYVSTLKLENLGNDPFSGLISLTISPANAHHASVVEATCPDYHVFIPAGGVVTVKVPIRLDKEGEWSVLLEAYNLNMDYELPQDMCHFESAVSLSSRFTDESPATLSLLEDVQLLTERCEVDGEISFQMILSNPGGKFSDRLGMQFYSGKAATGNPSFSIANDVEIAMGTEADTILVRGILSEAKGMKKYYARPYYRNAYGDDQWLTLATATDESQTPDPIEIRVYNATGIETITADDTQARDIQRYDLFGRPVQSEQGRFIVRDGQKQFVR